jgi:hypothetical protein
LVSFTLPVARIILTRPFSLSGPLPPVFALAITFVEVRIECVSLRAGGGGGLSSMFLGWVFG